ncbi:MAG: class I SAM-dependent methyltransferase [Spirochaetia bacterium]|jgi:2-polyprenyl-3-methyl-5-hydroxy-6-metoxy-1,4-benzoquinol methylase|nr:class I SAM-dependent methyltransferase [Spirochaetia bacterium]
MIENTSDKTMDSYNKAAEKYEEIFFKYQPYTKQIEIFNGFIPEGSEILDIGCGPGINAGILSGFGHKVTGFDYCEKMVELAKKNCPSGNFSVNTVGNFSSSLRYDALCLSFIIVHLGNDAVNELILKLGSLLKLPGFVYISFMTGKKPVFEKTSFSENEIFFNYFRTEEVISSFKKQHFEPVYNASEPYAESDGSLTEDVFLFFRKDS